MAVAAGQSRNGEAGLNLLSKVTVDLFTARED
jgi:hypothetical protein